MDIWCWLGLCAVTHSRRCTSYGGQGQQHGCQPLGVERAAGPATKEDSLLCSGPQSPPEMDSTSFSESECPLASERSRRNVWILFELVADSSSGRESRTKQHGWATLLLWQKRGETQTQGHNPPEESKTIRCSFENASYSTQPVSTAKCLAKTIYTMSLLEVPIQMWT